MPSLQMLMALRVKGRATVDTLASATDTDVDDVRAALAPLVASGAIATSAEPLVLGPSGMATLRALLAAEAVDRDELARANEDFLATDARLKAAITAWQLAPATERALPLRRVRDAGEAARGVVTRLARSAPRYAAYARRLQASLVAIDAGETRFVASPQVDSLHQVWFELHEDLLVTLGRERRA